MTRHDLAAGGAICVAFLAVAGIGLDRRGATAEEVQPYLRRHPLVLEDRDGEIVPMPPHDRGATGPGWIATSQWPVVAWQGETRMWPVLVSGHQSALGSYAGIALGPLLGDGPVGRRRSALVVAACILALTFAAARRLGLERRGAALACLLLATSPGFLFLSRSAFEWEAASRIGLLVAVLLAGNPRAPGVARAAAIGAAAGLAIVARATIGTTLIPALAALLLAREAPLRFRPGAALGFTVAAVPVALLLALGWASTLRARAAPLATFPFAELPARTAGVGRQLLVQLAWLGDARAILGAVFGGETRLATGALVVAAVAGAVPLALASVRWWRGTATAAERVLVVTVPTSALLGAWLYREPNEFQLAFGVEPLHALAAGALLGASTARPRLLGAVAAAVVAARALTGLSAVGMEARPGNPMLSRAVQRAAVDRLTALGATGPDVVTTTYNQAGVLEAWSDERLRPVHAWPVLIDRGAPGEPDRLARAWRAIVDRYRPRWVLLLAGSNLYEGRGSDAAAIEAALLGVAAERKLAVALEADLPTECGAPGWRLVRLDPLP